MGESKRPMPRLSVLRLPSRLHRRARRSRLATMLTILGLILAIITPLYWIYKPPTFLISHFQSRYPDVLFHVPTTQKVIALTIDDAPSEYTKQIMDVLTANEASATFFVIGSQVPGREIALAEMVQRGMELGNHAMKDEPSKDLTDSTLVEQIHAVDEMIAAAYRAAAWQASSSLGAEEGGVAMKSPPKYFRPGSGFFSQRMREALQRLGYRLVLGSIYPHDPQIPYWRVNSRHILSMLRPGGIIICHDRRSWTVPMLKKVIPEMRRRGYKIVSVGELLRVTASDMAVR